MGTCLQCYSPYILSSGRCVLSCASGTYLDIITMECKVCNAQCSTCGSEGYCTKCKNTTYILYNGLCITTCPAGTLLTTVNGIKFCYLIPCLNENFQFATTNGSCLSCLRPYILYNSSCITSCPLSTYFS